jgi:hypothetical protein
MRWCRRARRCSRACKKATDYGDFLAKAIYFDHLTKRRSKTEKEALAKVSEEYIHYDTLPGRSRGYMENMGLWWFMNYKLKSTKVALSIIRDNPVQALLSSVSPLRHYSPLPIDSPLDSNIFAKLWNGKIGYSIGPQQFFRAPGLLPSVNLLFH